MFREGRHVEKSKCRSENQHCFFIGVSSIFREKSMENRSKNDAKIDPNIIIKADSQNVEILLPVEARSSKTRFQQPSNPSKFDEKSMQKVGSFPDRSWDRFLMDFGAILAPKWEEILHRIRRFLIIVLDVDPERLRKPFF